MTRLFSKLDEREPWLVSMNKLDSANEERNEIVENNCDGALGIRW